MDLALITIKQVFILFILIFTGFLAVKTKIIGIEGKKAFSNLLLYFIVPCMVLQSYMMEFHIEVLHNLLFAFGMSFVLMFTGLIVSNLLIPKKNNKNAVIERFACIFSNAGYMGFPLIQALFGSEGMIYASAFLTIFNIIVWTYGYVIASGNTDWKHIGMSLAKNPVIYAVIIGLAIYLLRIPVHEILVQPITLFGNMNTPVAMFITGMIIADSDIGKLLKQKEIGKVLAIRLVVIPAICFLLAFLLQLHGMVSQVVLLLEMCPTAAITTVFAVQFGHQEDIAAGSVVFTTLLSIIILPVYAFLMQSIM